MTILILLSYNIGLRVLDRRSRGRETFIWSTANGPRLHTVYGRCGPNNAAFYSTWSRVLYDSDHRGSSRISSVQIALTDRILSHLIWSELDGNVSAVHSTRFGWHEMRWDERNKRGLVYKSGNYAPSSPATAYNRLKSGPYSEGEVAGVEIPPPKKKSAQKFPSLPFAALLSMCILRMLVLMSWTS